MTIKDLLNEELQDKRTNDKIIVFDIDNTLLTAKDIFIYLKDPTGKKDINKLTPEQYDGMTKEQKKLSTKNGETWDFREFRDPDKIYTSIVYGKGKLPVLKMLDRHVKAGWHVGIITARGVEDSVKQAIRDWLRAKVGDKLVMVPKLNPANIHAINDEKKRAEGIYKGYNKNPQLEKFLSKYKVVKFVDDSQEHLANASKIKVPAGKVFKTVDANRENR